MTRLLVWALVALAGCAQLGPKGTLTPENFAGGNLYAVQDAIAEWNEAVPRLQLRLVPDGGDWVIRQEAMPDEPRFGHTDRVRARIRIDVRKLTEAFPRAPLEHIKSTTMHEIGHALGMRDHAPKGLMVSPHGGFTCVDAVTLAWLLEVQPELAPGARVTCG